MARRFEYLNKMEDITMSLGQPKLVTIPGLSLGLTYVSPMADCSWKIIEEKEKFLEECPEQWKIWREETNEWKVWQEEQESLKAADEASLLAEEQARWKAWQKDQDYVELADGAFLVADEQAQWEAWRKAQNCTYVFKKNYVLEPKVLSVGRSVLIICFFTCELAHYLM